MAALFSRVDSCGIVGSDPLIGPVATVTTNIMPASGA
jgi:hypothetical protein